MRLLVLACVVALGCQEGEYKPASGVKKVEAIEDYPVDRPASLDYYAREKEFMDLHERVHAEEEYEARQTAACEKAFGKGWKLGDGVTEQEDVFTYFSRPSCVFHDEKVLPEEKS